MTRIFYRVQELGTTKGLWYDRDGIFNNRIQTKEEFGFLRHKNLPMEKDDAIPIGWLSATHSLQTLFDWFNMDELRILKSRNIYLFGYRVSYENYMWYSKYNHYLINSQNFELILKMDPV